MIYTTLEIPHYKEYLDLQSSNVSRSCHANYVLDIWKTIHENTTNQNERRNKQNVNNPRQWGNTIPVLVHEYPYGETSNPRRKFSGLSHPRAQGRNLKPLERVHLYTSTLLLSFIKPSERLKRWCGFYPNSPKVEHRFCTDSHDFTMIPNLHLTQRRFSYANN